MKEKNIAMCGLDCSSCAAFIATKNNDGSLREETAREWNAKPHHSGLTAEDINCNGCLSEGALFVTCQKCDVRACGLERKLNNCGECEEYRCSKLKKRHARSPAGKKVCDGIRI